MFLNLPGPVEFNDPWTASPDARLADLVRRPIHVAYYYEDPDNSTFRYRVYNMIQALKEICCDISAAWFREKDGLYLDRAFDRADVIVIGRARYTAELNRLITRAKRRGTSIVYDVDDLVFDTDFAHLIVQTLDQDLSHPAVWDHWFGYIARIGAALKLCDRAITTNKFLAEKIRDFHPKMDVRVVPNFLNREQLEISEAILAAKVKTDFESNGQIHIGYFSGTPTHNRDFDVAAHALATILDRHPRTMLRLVGYLDVRGPLSKHTARIDRHPFQDFVNLQRLIGSTEINIAPLQDNIFTNCKSELKYFEAAIVGTATIASPTYVFKEAIDSGRNGFLSQSHQWEDRLDELVTSLKQKPTSYIDVALAGATHARQKYALENQIASLKSALIGQSSCEHSQEVKVE